MLMLKKNSVLGTFAAIVLVASVAAPGAVAQEKKDVKLTFGGEIRFRGEYQANAQDLNDDGLSDDQALFWPYRARLSAMGRFAKNVEALLEIQNAGVAGGDATATNPTRTGFDVFGVQGNSTELYRAHVTLRQLWADSFSLRFGRQEIVAGSELLLGNLDFYAGLSHDGVVGIWNLEKAKIRAWYTRPFEGSTSALDGGGFLPPDQVFISGPGSTVHFFGGYGTWSPAREQTLDVYLMGLNNRSLTNVNFQTIGGRWEQPAKPGSDGFLWNVEVALQNGDGGVGPGPVDQDASGRVIEGWFGYNFARSDRDHRVFLRAASATGDDPTTADDNEGFIPLFGDFHNRLGRGDWFRLADDTTGLAGGVSGGIVALAAGYRLMTGDHRFGIQYWDYKLEEDAGGPDGLGQAIDLWYRLKYSDNVDLALSLSQLSPDDALKALAGGMDDPVTRLYGEVRLHF